MSLLCLVRYFNALQRVAINGKTSIQIKNRGKALVDAKLTAISKTMKRRGRVIFSPRLMLGGHTQVINISVLKIVINKAVARNTR